MNPTHTEELFTNTFTSKVYYIHLIPSIIDTSKTMQQI